MDSRVFVSVAPFGLLDRLSRTNDADRLDRLGDGESEEAHDVERYVRPDRYVSDDTHGVAW